MSPEDRRQAIISATTDLVLEHGPAATTRQIADACGIAEGTLFRVFESKDDILAAVANAWSKMTMKSWVKYGLSPLFSSRFIA